MEVKVFLEVCLVLYFLKTSEIIKIAKKHAYLLRVYIYICDVICIYCLESILIDTLSNLSISLKNLPRQLSSLNNHIDMKSNPCNSQGGNLLSNLLAKALWPEKQKW